MNHPLSPDEPSIDSLYVGKVPVVIKKIIEEKTSDNKKHHAHYKLGRYLGKGAFCKCYEFVRCDDISISYAAKIIPKLKLVSIS